MKKYKKRKSKIIIVSLFPITILVLMVLYTYYGQSNNDIHSQPLYQLPNPAGFGIDVSEHQKIIDWDVIDQEQVDFAIIRTGYGYKEDGNIDLYFYENIKVAKQNGFDVGVYHYSYATSEEEARKEAEFVLSILDNMSLDLPVYFDFEDECHDSLSYDELNNITSTFLTTIENAGYKTGLYANLDRINRLDKNILDGHDIWIASYGSEPYYPGNIKMWQYTNQGKIDGISTHVDLNYSY